MIHFNYVRWKNFLSTGNVFTEVRLDKSPSTLIVGENGAGKSTILDALCFVLYGKPFRAVKKDQLINSINQGGTVVEIGFETNGRRYKIIRGIKPAIFEIYQDDQLINQNASARDYQDILERQILRMNIKSFTQIVILGSSSFVPFMQLKPDVRREVIEDLLDIRVFSTMLSLLKAKMQVTKDSLVLNERDIQSTEALIKTNEIHLQRMSADNQTIINNAETSIVDLRGDIAKYEAEIEAEDSEITKLFDQITDEASYQKTQRDIDKIEAGFATKLKAAEARIAFYRDNDHCPTCTQPIDETIKTKNIAAKEAIIEEIDSARQELAWKMQETETHLAMFAAIKKQITERRRNIQERLRPAIQQFKREIEFLECKIDDLRSIKTADIQKELDDLQAKLAIHKAEHVTHVTARELFNIAHVILRDTGIKSRIIKQYIPVINTLVNKYLAAMDFFVKFELNDQFEEHILSRHRDDFTYASFSEGEKLRVDISLLFTWRAIARMKNSASTNLLILDEVFDASLDAAGCEEILRIINETENTNIFVISHKGDLLQDKFRSSIRFEKHANFSRIAQP